MAPKTTANAAPAPNVARKRAMPVSKLREAKAQLVGTKKATPDKKQKMDRPGREGEGHASAPTNQSNKRKRAMQTATGDSNGFPGRLEKGDHAEPAPTKLSKRAKPSASGRGAVAKTNVVAHKTRALEIGRKINEAPRATLDIFVFGEGAGAELGLGSKTINGQAPTEVVRPRLNRLLSSKDVGVVQVACGGMHAVCLTRDNKILMWGVNDLGALGRATDADEDEDDELNPAESTPGPVDTSGLNPQIRWAQVAASDNASFALTEDGRVYGWGTFRSDDGVMGFSGQVLVQNTPILIPDLKNVRQLAAGNNHVLALDSTGKVFAWGCGDQGQLGRRVLIGHPRLALRPTSTGALPRRGTKAARVACGSYHSFNLDTQGQLYAWGLNTYAELGITDEAGESNASQLKPRLVEDLRNYKIIDIAGGEHHSLACTEDGKLLTWGRVDGYQVGLPVGASTPDNAVFDDRNKPRILKKPTVIPDIPAIVSVAAGTDHSFALSRDGRVYSWGFSANGRTGQGTEDDIEVPTLIDNKAIRGKKLVFAGAGGPFSILASVADGGVDPSK